MNETTTATVKWLSAAIGKAIQSAKFCVAGNLPNVDPGIVVEGVGPIKLPLKPASVKKLVAASQIAPFGKGTQTLVDKEVRNTYELDPKAFHLSDAWNAAIAGLMGPIAQQLGLPADQLEARLYKLLVYKTGGFFLPHRDSEKHDRMVASLIVALPNPFSGGRLIVKHGAVTEKMKFEEAAQGSSPSYAAFYADCEHEVERVDRGVRLCLAYNLVLKSTAVASTAGGKRVASADDALVGAIRSWIAKQPAKPLVFALEHHYTQHGLSLDLLKGGDRKLADLVVSAAEQAGCITHLAQVSRHLLQWADDGSFGDGYSRRYRDPWREKPKRKITIGETYEDDLDGSEWTDLEGKKQPWGKIALNLSAIVSAEPIETWKPTSEEFEGFTGNAGNTLDRWYHRSAIVVWPRERHFDVVASTGSQSSIPLFLSMSAKLAKTPKKRLEAARDDCVRFARAIIAQWTDRSFGYGPSERGKSIFDEFAAELLTLHDRDTIALFLTRLAENDRTLKLSSFVVAACREFGWTAFAEEMKRLIVSRPVRRGDDHIPFRDVEWLAAYCCDLEASPEKSALAQELCALAVERFCEPHPPRNTYYRSGIRQEATVVEKSLPFLLKALAACGLDESLARVIRFVQESPAEFNVDSCQVPCLKTIVPWSQTKLGSVPPPIASWLRSMRQRLESATAQAPAPPTDWARPANVSCTCPLCKQLKTILEDPVSKVGRISAAEHARQHVTMQIDREEFDVKHELERKGSPYSLLLTKTNGSYDRAVKRFEKDRRLLSELPAAD